MTIDFKDRIRSVCVWVRRNYEMNKYLSLVHLTSMVGPQSSDSKRRVRFSVSALNLLMQISCQPERPVLTSKRNE